MNRIETAKETHIPELADFLRILFTQEDEFIPVRDNQINGLGMIISNPETGKIYVIIENERIVGMVSILYTVSTALGGKVGILEDMIIHPDFQGRGYGKKLIDRALTHARDEGLKRITLLTDHDNERALGFYQKSGFTRSSMIPLRKML